MELKFLPYDRPGLTLLVLLGVPGFIRKLMGLCVSPSCASARR